MAFRHRWFRHVHAQPQSLLVLPSCHSPGREGLWSFVGYGTTNTRQSGGEEITRIRTQLANLRPPEKPVEGECCGTGCTNCVWVYYWEAQEDYLAEKAKLKRRLQQLMSNETDPDQSGERRDKEEAKKAVEQSIAEDVMGMDPTLRAFLEFERKQGQKP